MPARRILGAIALVMLLLALTGCGVSYEASEQRMNGLITARKEVRGAWVVLDSPEGIPVGGELVREVGGELLAADPDTVFVLLEAGSTAFASRNLARATIAAYEAGRPPGSQPVLVITEPQPAQLGALARHARFPQGLPPGFDRRTPSP